MKNLIRVSFCELCCNIDGRSHNVSIVELSYNINGKRMLVSMVPLICVVSPCRKNRTLYRNFLD